MWIDSVDRSSLYRHGSLRIKETLAGRNTAEVTFFDAAQTYRPSVGELVEVLHSGATIFKGTVDKADEEDPPAGNFNRLKITCVDFNQLSNRFLVAKRYDTSGQTLQDIVEDIVTVETELSLEGVTVEDIVGDPNIEAAHFDYRTVRQAFDDLARESGYSWNIGYDKVLRFSGLGSVSSGVYFQESGTNNYIAARILRTREKYRNRQFVRGEKQTTDPRTETFVGDGERQTFTLAFEVANDPEQVRPTIKVDGVAQDVGVRGAEAEEEFDWLYALGEKEISQELASTPLTAGQTLSVEYIGQFPFIVEYEDSSEITARAALEGGSGVYENLEVDEDLRGIQLAFDRAAGFLRRFGSITAEARIETYDGTAAPGETVIVDLADHGISMEEYLVEMKSISDVGSGTDVLRYQYRVSSPPEEFESWIEFFGKLFAAGKKTVIGRQNEALLLTRSVSETITVSNTVETLASPGTLTNHNLYDSSTAARIGEIGGNPSMVIGSALFGPHNAD